MHRFTIIVFFLTISNIGISQSVRQPVRSKLILTPVVENIITIPEEFQTLSLEQFLNITPEDYKKVTGQKLGFKRSLQLRLAQATLKKVFGF